MKRNNQLNMFILGCLFVLSLGWTYSWDVTTPAGTDSPSVIDNRIREVKQVVQEMLNVDHYFPLTGTQVSDADAGKHRQINFQANITTPAHVTGETHLYQKGGELYWQDATNTEVALTSAGVLLLAANSVGASQISTGAVTTAEILDETIASADILDGTIAEADLAAAVVAKLTMSPGTYSGGESVTLPNGLIMKMGYIASAETATVTFGVAFPTALISVSATPFATQAIGNDTYISARSTSAISIKNTNYGNVTGYYWIAIGY